MRIETHSPEEAAEVIYETLTSSKFEKWYASRLEDHITGFSSAEVGPVLKSDIIADIKRIFSINQ